jgi:hypothetical protein
MFVFEIDTYLQLLHFQFWYLYIYPCFHYVQVKLPIWPHMLKRKTNVLFMQYFQINITPKQINIYQYAK